MLKQLIISIGLCFAMVSGHITQAVAAEGETIYTFKIKSASSEGTLRATKKKVASGELWDERKQGGTCKIKMENTITEIENPLREGFSISVLVIDDTDDIIKTLVNLSQSKFDVKGVTEINSDCSIVNGTMQAQTYNGVLDVTPGKPTFVKFIDQILVLTVTKETPPNSAPPSTQGVTHAESKI
jgi:hypothetical protein